MENYKEDIVKTRIGGLGSSDAKIVASVSQTGKLNTTANDRIAQMLGLAERPNVHTPQMAIGDAVEMLLFNAVKIDCPNAVSNPLYVSSEMSERYGFDVLNHIDIEAEEDGQLIWWECKASKYSTPDVMHDYDMQFCWHWLLLREKAEKMGLQPRLFLLHYQTDDVQFHYGDNGEVIIENFDKEKTAVVEINEPNVDWFSAGLKIISDIVKSGKFEYKKGDDIDADALPENLRENVREIEKLSAEKARIDARIEELKADFDEYMLANDKKTIYCQYGTISRSAGATRSTLDSKLLKSEKPEIYAQYVKTTTSSPTISYRTNNKQ